MMKGALRTFFLIFTLIITSCGTYVYHSVTPKTPLLTKRNDFVGQLNIGGAGAEVYAAYAPVNYLGLSLSDAGNKKNTDSSSTGVASTFGDYEMLFVPFYPYKNMSFEMPIGLGLTKSKSLDNSFATYSPYTRAFVQPTVGFHSSENFEMALFMRLSQLDYSVDKWGVDQRYEPGIMIRGGSKSIKGMFQFRFDTGTNFSRTPAAKLRAENQVLYLPFHISLGINFSLNFSKKKEGEAK